MAERYSKIFKYRENTYAEGSPVIISAGALLFDNINNSVLAQLKFCSVSKKIIKALTIEITQLDTAKRVLGEKIKFQYLDLDIKIDEMFSSKTPVPVPDVTTRAFFVTVDEVVFEDNSVWKSENNIWEELPSLERQLTDFELLKQFKIKYGFEYKNHLKKEKDLWFCFCGAISKGEKCHTCGSLLSKLEEFDLDTLKSECDERLAEEQKHKELQQEELRIKQLKEKEEAAIRRKKYKKISLITIPVISVIVAFVIVFNTVIIPNGEYNDALALMKEGRYTEAITAFNKLEGYKDSAEKIQECKYNNAIELMNKGKHREAIFVFSELGYYKNSKEYVKELRTKICDQYTVISSKDFNNGSTIGLKSDGTVVFKSDSYYLNWQKSSIYWSDIISIDAGSDYVVGLKSDGTAIAESAPWYSIDLSNFINIISISVGPEHVIGLKLDGTVVAAGLDGFGRDNVSDWKDIVAVSAGNRHTVGLKSDGTVVAVGDNECGQCDVSGWKDIVAISAGFIHTVGLKSDGTVVATGYNHNKECELSDWKDIVAISAGKSYTVGLKSDGTVVAVGDNEDGECEVSEWRDIIAINAGYAHHTVGLKSDGTVVAVGNNKYGQCDVSDWENIKIPNGK